MELKEEKFGEPEGEELAKLNEELAKIAEDRKQALRDSDASMSDDEDDDDDEGGGKSTRKKGRRPKLTTYQQISRALTHIGSSFGKAFMDYGPPYFDDPERESLVEACSQMVVNVIQVHSLLNQRADPNERDEKDFYFCAMHYCARNGNLLVMRMLRRAGGEINILNEFGQSPLSLCCLQVSTPEKVEVQHKMFLWLIKEGADIHHRDRSGLEPIDYCAMNNDMEKILVLLELGARVRRENFMLQSAPKKSILKHVSDPDVYRVLKEALEEEEAAFQEREAVRQGDKDEREREEQAQRNLRLLKKKKEKRKENARKAVEYDELLAKLDRRKKNLAASMNSLTSGKKAQAKTLGSYVRDSFGNWTWVAKDRRDSEEAVSESIYLASTTMMHRLRDKNKLSLMQERWSKMGGEGKIELDWKRDEPFYLEGEEREARARGGDDDDDDDDDGEEHEADAELRDLLEGEDLEELLG